MYAKIFLCCFCYVLIVVNAAPSKFSPPKEWNSFKTDFKKLYNSNTEEEHRYKVFSENKRMVDLHNEKFRKGEVTYEMALNDFSDLPFSEFSKRATGCLFDLRRANINEKNKTLYYQAPKRGSVPSSVDWQSKGAVTPVQNQRQCGSCWAFTGVAALEAQHFIKTGRLIGLSEQELVDCSTSYGNHACDGGLANFAYEYVKDRGIATRDSYPYQGIQNRCRNNIKKSGVRARGYQQIQRNEEALKQAVATLGPISVGIDATVSLQNYRRGIYYGTDCSSSNLNHAVLVVGYGTENGQDYWLVKNSWGTTWGMNGYVKMSRNKGNNCGIATDATIPLL